MHKILKSLLPTEDHINSFQRLCNCQIEEMRAHDRHMKMVNKDPKNYHPYPAPIAHPDVMAAIVPDGKDYNIAFEIEDDTPKLTLDEKKQKLSADLNQSIFDLQCSLLPPPLKLKLYNIEIGQIASIKEEDRTKEQKSKLDAYVRASSILSKAHEIAAQAESDIHDLTEKTIDKWKLPDLEITK